MVRDVLVATADWQYDAITIGLPTCCRLTAVLPSMPSGPGNGKLMEVKTMMVRIGNPKDVAAGQMHAFDVAGTKVT